MPDADPAQAPRLDPAIWTPDRLDKVVRALCDGVRAHLDAVLLDRRGRRRDAPRPRSRGPAHPGCSCDETAALLGYPLAARRAHAPKYLSEVARAQGETVATTPRARWP